MPCTTSSSATASRPRTRSIPGSMPISGRSVTPRSRAARRAPPATPCSSSSTYGTPASIGRPRQERLKLRRQHADDHVRTGLADQPPHGPGLPGVERDDPRLAVALARDVALGLTDVELRHRDRGDDVALLQVVHHGLALQAHAENQCFHGFSFNSGKNCFRAMIRHRWPVSPLTRLAFTGPRANGSTGQRRYKLRSRGSRASRSPSPSRLIDRIVSMMASPGRVTSHQASVM